MVRQLLRASAAIAFAALLWPAQPSAAPIPGIAYDEIVRIVVNATPPPPGNFQGDLAAVRTQNPAPVAAATTPPKHRGFGSLLNVAGAVLAGGSVSSNEVGGAVVNQVVSNAMEAAVQRSLAGQYAGLAGIANSFLQPRVMHYAYWNGWERVDDVASQTATIRKCDMGQVIHLDLAHKTYRVDVPSEESPSLPPAPRAPSQPQSPQTPQPPGSGTASFTLTSKGLGAQSIDSHSTVGYDTTATFAMTNATGSCHNGNGSIETLEYLPAIARPAVNACPVRPLQVPEGPVEIVAPPSGGCRPTFAMHASGPQPPANRLSLYTLVRIGTGASSRGQQGTGGFGFLTERGNLQTLGPSSAALFAIPQGFTKAP